MGAKDEPRAQNADMPIGPELEIRSVRESDAEAIHRIVKAVAAERRYLATIGGFSLEETRTFLRHIIAGNLPQATAIVADTVVGFCDVLPNSAEGFTHVARLGMAVRTEWRRRGIGRALVEQCLALAKQRGIEKVELEVFSDNLAAIRLYEHAGFSREGVKVRGRKLDRCYQDVVLMARWL